MIPVKIRYDHKPLSVELKVKWTPTLVVWDKEGNEITGTVGFLRPKATVPFWPLLGVGKADFDIGQYKQAVAANLRSTPGSTPRAMAAEAVLPLQNLQRSEAAERNRTRSSQPTIPTVSGPSGLSRIVC